jgi:hypothetical protein
MAVIGTTRNHREHALVLTGRDQGFGRWSPVVEHVRSWCGSLAIARSAQLGVMPSVRKVVEIERSWRVCAAEVRCYFTRSCCDK